MSLVGWNPFREVLASCNRMSVPRPKSAATADGPLEADVR
jgi:hypothetical protein